MLFIPKCTGVSRFSGPGPSTPKCPLNRDSPLNRIIPLSEYGLWKLLNKTKILSKTKKNKEKGNLNFKAFCKSIKYVVCMLTQRLIQNLLKLVSY